MREQERKVLEKAINTVKIMIDSEIKEEYADTKYCMMYLEDTINSLIGYASIQCRFAGMDTEDLYEFIKTVTEFKNLMYDKINNAKEI